MSDLPAGLKEQDLPAGLKEQPEWDIKDYLPEQGSFGKKIISTAENLVSKKSIDKVDKMIQDLTPSWYKPKSDSGHLFAATKNDNSDLPAGLREEQDLPAGLKKSFTAKDFAKGVLNESLRVGTGGVVKDFFRDRGQTKEEIAWQTAIKNKDREIDSPVNKLQGVQEEITSPEDIAIGLTAGKLLSPTIGPVKNALSQFTFGASDIAIPASEKVVQGISKKVVNQFIKDETAIKQAGKWTWNKVKNVFTREVIDKEGNVKKVLLNEGAKDAVIKREIADRSGAQAAIEMQQIDNQVFSGISKNEITDLNRVRESLRSIETGKRGLKNPGGITAEEHAQFLDEFKNINPEYYDKIISKSQEIDQVYQQLLKDKLDAGLISKESYDSIIANNEYYNPRHFIQHMDDSLGSLRPKVKGKTGIKSLTTGSEEALEKDSRKLLQQSIAETKSVIAKNQANQALYETAKNPDRIVKVLGKGKEAPVGFETIDVFNNGIKEQMIMPKDLAKEWNGLDPLLNQTFANWLQILSGTKLLKSMATGLNPVFALGNLPRDIGYIYLNSKEYSTFIPKYSVQMLKDLAITFKSAVTKKGLYQEFVKEAGGLETLTKQSRFLDKHFNKLQDIAGAFGNFSERWTRLAHMNRAMTNGSSAKEAANYAIDILDFGQGGRVAKAIDNIVPYFNAGIQGTRGTVRSAINNPGRFAAKMANLGGVATGLYFYNHYNNKDAYDMIPPEVKSSNFCFTTGLNFKDKDGDTRHIYFTIPMDQSQRIIISGFEAAAKVITGDEQDTKQLGKSAREFTNMFPEEGGFLSPTAKATMGYQQNYDFYRKSKIWKHGEVKAIDEWTEQTPETFKEWGKLTGMSPDKGQYALQQFFTSNNFFTNLFSLGSKEIVEAMNDIDKDWTLEEIQQAIPGLSKYMRITPKINPKDWDMIDEMKKEIGSKNINIRRDIQRLHKKEPEKLWEYVSQLDVQDISKFSKEAAELITTEGIPNQAWYRLVRSLPAEIKEIIFMKKYQNSDPEVQVEIMKNAGQMKGILKPVFKQQALKDED